MDYILNGSERLLLKVRRALAAVAASDCQFRRVANATLPVSLSLSLSLSLRIDPTWAGSIRFAGALTSAGYAESVARDPPHWPAVTSRSAQSADRLCGPLYAHGPFERATRWEAHNLGEPPTGAI